MHLFKSDNLAKVKLDYGERKSLVTQMEIE